MKKFFLFLLATATMGLYAQNTFFPTTAGTVLTYVQKNDKGKEDSYTRQTIKDVQVKGDETVIFYSFELLEKNQKSKNQPFDCKVMIKGDVVTFDMNEAFASMQQDPEMRAAIEITGIPLEISGSLRPGDKIKDAEMTMTMSVGFIKMSTIVKMMDGECLAIEEVTVPAGTFSCHKITQTSHTSVMGKNAEAKTISWYALGVGVVKTETYDDKGKFKNSTELVSLKQ
jgi:hypothetical protein